MSGPDHDHIELFRELHSLISARQVLRLRSGFRRAAQTPRKRLNFAPGMSGPDHDHIELFRELHESLF
jgi:hypothetical protein